MICFKRRILVLIIIAILLWIQGCQAGNPEPSRLVEKSGAPTNNTAPTQSSTKTSTPTKTIANTQTPTPQPTATTVNYTPTPTRISKPFNSFEGLTASNIAKIGVVQEIYTTVNRRLAWSPDSRYFGVFSAGKAYTIYEKGASELVLTYTISKVGDYGAIGFSPDNQTFFVTEPSGTIRQWNHRTGKGVRSYKAYGDLWMIAFSPTGKQIAVGGPDGVVVTFDTSNGEELDSPPEQYVYVEGIFYLSEAQLLIVSSADAMVWTPPSARPTKKIVFNTQYSVNSTALSPDKKTLAVGLSNSEVLLVSVPDLKIIKQIKWHSSEVTALSYSPDGKLLASAENNGAALVHDVTEWKERAKFAPGGPVMSLVFSPDGKLIATGSGGEAFIWGAP